MNIFIHGPGEYDAGTFFTFEFIHISSFASLFLPVHLKKKKIQEKKTII